jgi:hypothetical protein
VHLSEISGELRTPGGGSPGARSLGHLVPLRRHVARRLAELVDDGDAQGEHGDRPELRAGGSGECGECGDCADRARDDADDAAEPTAGEQRERGDDLDLLP